MNRSRFLEVPSANSGQLSCGHVGRGLRDLHRATFDELGVAVAVPVEQRADLILRVGDKAVHRHDGAHHLSWVVRGWTLLMSCLFVVVSPLVGLSWRVGSCRALAVGRFLNAGGRR